MCPSLPNTGWPCNAPRPTPACWPSQATTRCWGVATSIFTACLWSARNHWSSPAASWPCSRPAALRPTRARPCSSRALLPLGGWGRCLTSRTGKCFLLTCMRASNSARWCLAGRRQRSKARAVPSSCNPWKNSIRASERWNSRPKTLRWSIRTRARHPSFAPSETRTSPGRCTARIPCWCATGLSLIRTASCPTRRPGPCSTPPCFT